MRIQQKSKHKPVKIVATIIGALLLIVGVAFSYAYMNHLWPFSMGRSKDTSSQKKTIDYSGPSDSDISSSQDAKKRIAAEEDVANSSSSTSSSSTSSKKTVGVGVTYADIYNGNLEIRAFTNGVIEGTGTCTATATMKDMPSMVITKSSEAFVDVSSSQCNPIYIPISQLKSGTWEVVVKFSSPDSEGSSGAVEVKVP